MEETDFDNSAEILNYDGDYTLSVEYGDAYMLMSHPVIHNHEAIEEGETIHFNVDDGLVTEAQVATADAVSGGTE